MKSYYTQEDIQGIVKFYIGHKDDHDLVSQQAKYLLEAMANTYFAEDQMDLIRDHDWEFSLSDGHFYHQFCVNIEKIGIKIDEQKELAEVYELINRLSNIGYTSMLGNDGHGPCCKVLYYGEYYFILDDSELDDFIEDCPLIVPF